MVTPLAGVWIEIPQFPLLTGTPPVTPLAGVWIEIVMLSQEFIELSVTPLAGVWIEILQLNDFQGNIVGHSPCGSVD